MEEKVHRYEIPILYRSITSSLHWQPKRKSRKIVAPQSEIGNLRRLQLKLQFVCDKGDEFRIRGFSLTQLLSSSKIIVNLIFAARPRRLFAAPTGSSSKAEPPRMALGDYSSQRRSGVLFFVLEICHFRGLQLKLQFVSNQGDKFRVRGFSLGIADCVAKEPL